MTYSDAVQFIVESYTKGKKQGLAVLRAVLSHMGEPQNALRIIHVAGTNGKGSVCAMLSSVLMAAGYTAGMFTSPHLHRFNERFALNGVPVSDDLLAEHIARTKSAMQKALPAGEWLSYFEILTAAAFSLFHAAGVDYLLLEAGIGGRLDATNVADACVLSIITSIGCDHMEILGGTISAIAKEKGGIIKKNCPVVLYSCDNTVYNSMSGIAAAQNAVLYHDGQTQLDITREDCTGLTFTLRTRYFTYEELTLKLFGAYQFMNAATAVLSVHALRAQGLRISDCALRTGLAQAQWPGRMEVVGQNPLIVLDGAHNRDGAEIFGRCAAQYFAGRHITALIGILHGKEYEVIVNELSRNADAVVLTKPAYAARAREPLALYQALENKHRLIITEPNYKRAMDLALRVTPPDGVIVCAGSLYLVGDVLRHIQDTR